MANGIRIHYWRTGGNKTPLVLAHGSSGDGLCWTNLAKELQNDYDLILFDAHGHGMTDPPVRADPADVQVEDLAGLIRELKLQADPHGTLNGSRVCRVVRGEVSRHSPGRSARRSGLGEKAERAVTPGVPADPEQRKDGILARNNMTEEQLVGGCLRDSPKWGRSECEIWAPSKRRHHPNTALGSMAGRPQMSELFPKTTAPTLSLKAGAQGELRARNEPIAGLLKNGKVAMSRARPITRPARSEATRPRRGVETVPHQFVGPDCHRLDLRIVSRATGGTK
jgi:hypothetical protein